MPTLLETNDSICDQLTTMLYGSKMGEAREMIGEMLIDRAFEAVQNPEKDFFDLGDGMKHLARQAIDRAVGEEPLHAVNQQFFYRVFGVQADSYGPDQPLQPEPVPKDWPVFGPDEPLFSAA